MPTAKRPGWFVTALCSGAALWAIFGAQPSAQPGFKFNSNGELIIGGGSSNIPISNGDITSTASQIGPTTDAAATGDANGSVNAHLRYLAKAVASFWDSGSNRVNVAVQNGSATATVGGVANTALTWMQYPTLQKGGTAAMTGTTSTQVIAAVASNYLYIGSCSVGNTHASVDTLVDLQDGSGGTVIWTFTAVHGYGGESHTFNPPLKVPTLGNALFAVDETTGASVKVFCQGFSSTTSY